VDDKKDKIRFIADETELAGSMPDLSPKKVLDPSQLMQDWQAINSSLSAPHEKFEGCDLGAIVGGDTS